MKVLVIGSGGREHALAWKLSKSAKVDKVYVAPGNAGTALDAENVPISEKDFPALISFAREHEIDLTVVGPEAPLTAGLVDAFEEAGLRAFGPNKAAARMEGSKVFCKSVLIEANVPTARSRSFDDSSEATEYILASDSNDFVVKADGLAAGKGVVVCSSKEEAGSERSCDYRRSNDYDVATRPRPQSCLRRRSGPEHRRHGRLLPGVVSYR